MYLLLGLWLRNWVSLMLNLGGLWLLFLLLIHILL